MPSEASSKTIILLRMGEIFLKGGNRDRFVKAFIHEARRLVADIEGARVHPRYLRVEVEAPTDKLEACISRLKRLFGMQSLSPAVTTSTDIDSLCREALALANKSPAGTTFKVETNRRDKSYPLISPTVSRQVGGYIDDNSELVVNVRDPDLLIQIEITADKAYVFGEKIRGPGGLPLRTAGRAGLLLSGGIDSPVAAWYAMRRGLALHAIYFHSFPYTGDKSKEKVLALAKILTRWHGKLPVFVVHFTEVQKALRASGRGDLAVILYRRMMMRAAGIISKREGGSALITGENLGQVASQTIENMGVIEEASPLPVMRPLLCFDKTEIIDKAHEIDTFETSILPYDDCCSLFVPKHPATRARLSDIATPEATLEVDALAQSLADGAERLVVG